MINLNGNVAAGMSTQLGAGIDGASNENQFGINHIALGTIKQQSHLSIEVCIFDFGNSEAFGGEEKAQEKKREILRDIEGSDGFGCIYCSNENSNRVSFSYKAGDSIQHLHLDFQASDKQQILEGSLEAFFEKISETNQLTEEQRAAINDIALYGQEVWF